MIVQCEQCSTKFKLDDSKITDNGVRVRCAKCKHVFLVEKGAEEADFEKLLGGVDVPDVGEEAAQQPAAFDLSAFGAEMGNLPPVEEQPTVAEAPRKKSAMEIRGTPVSALTEDASRLLPPDEADAGLADMHAAGGGGEQPAPPEVHNEFDLSAAFADGSMPPEQGGAAEAPSTASPDEGAHGDVSLQHFEAEERGTGTDGLADISADSAFGQLPDGFSEEHLASTINGVFATDHDDSTAPVASAGPLKIEAGDIDSLDLGGDGWDLPASLDGEDEAPAAGENADHDAAALGFDFNAGAFGESSAGKPQAEDASLSAPAVQWEGSDESAVPASGNGGDSVNGGTGSGRVATMGETMTDGGEQVESNKSAAAGERQDESLAIVFPDVVPPSASAKGKKTDFSFDEDLPPLSIPSRRKESTSMATTILLVLLLVVAGGAGGGYYLLKEDPAFFNRLGLGEAAKLLQLGGGKDARIAIQGVQGKFLTSATDGALLVIRGEVVNNSGKPHSTVQVRVTLVRAKGAAPLQKTAYCGKALADEELVTLPMVEIDKRLNDPAGAPAAMELAPGKKIQFVAVFSQVPDDASDYGVEVVGASK